MTAVVALPGQSIVATDTRSTAHFESGDIHSDVGGKLRSVPGGWISGSGNGRFLFAALERFQSVGFPGPADITATLASLYRTHTAQLTDASPSSKVARTLFVAAAGSNAGAFKADGSRISWGPTVSGFSYPPGMPAIDGASVQHRTERFRKKAAGRGPLATVRHIAHEFAWAAAQTTAMSEIIEVGFGSNFIRAPAAELADATDAQILRRIIPPPSPPTDDPFAIFAAVAAQLEGGVP